MDISSGTQWEVNVNLLKKKKIGEQIQIMDQRNVKVNNQWTSAHEGIKYNQQWTKYINTTD